MRDSNLVQGGSYWVWICTRLGHHPMVILWKSTWTSTHCLLMLCKGSQRIKVCFIWILYAKVTRAQNVIDRWSEPTLEPRVKIKCVLIVEYVRRFLVQFRVGSCFEHHLPYAVSLQQNIDWIARTFKNVASFFISGCKICIEWPYIGNRFRFTYLLGMQSIEGWSHVDPNHACSLEC